MLIRIAIVPLILVLGFSGCKKPKSIASGTQLLNPAPEAGAAAAPVAPAAAAGSPAASPATAPAVTKPAIDQNAQVVIFGYHRFESKVRRPDTEITPELFEAQMKELKDKGIAVIGMQDFLAWKRGEKGIPAKCAIITFDDGWKSQYEVAWPIMKKYEYPLTLFIYTEGVRGGRFGGGGAMSWEQLAEMRDAGVDIQAHSVTHQDLRKAYDKTAKKKLSPEEYDAWLNTEIAGCKATLEQKLGIKVNCFAVPFGNINDRVREEAKKAGYEGIFTVYGQRLSVGAPNDSLGRYLMENNKPKVFAEAVNFSGATSGGSVPVSAVSNISSQPANGETVRTALPLIKANLSTFGAIEEGSVQMRVSGLGLVPYSYDAKTQTATYQVTQKLRDKTCTVIVSAKSGGKKVESSWSFNIEDSSAPAPAASAAASPAPPAPAKKK